jgi:DNA-binding NarL/FixJ family response regulator
MAVARYIEVMIADTDEFMRAGLRALLTAEGDMRVVAEAASTADALKQSARLGPDVVVLDSALPDAAAVADVCRAFRVQTPRTRVLVLIDRLDVSSVLGALLAGADGCIAKRARPDDVRRVVRAIAAGEVAMDAHVTRVVIDHLRHQPGRGSADANALSPAERRVLQLVAAGKTNREIAGELEISEKTVKNWLGHAFGKLHVSRRAEAAVRFTMPAASDEAALSARGGPGVAN